METLPNELIIVIFEFIKLITDKRQFLRTCPIYNKITKQSLLNYIRIIPKSYHLNRHCFSYHLDRYSMEKFTLELCHDGYFDLIPEHYINGDNDMLVGCASYYNNIPLLELSLSKSKGYSSYNIVMFGAMGGQIPVLEWCLKNKYNINYAIQYVVEDGHLHTLKWLKEQKCDFDISHDTKCYIAARNGDLEILKLLREIGFPWSCRVYEMALKNGNQELIKWMLENGCPTS